MPGHLPGTCHSGRRWTGKRRCYWMNSLMNPIRIHQLPRSLTCCRPPVSFPDLRCMLACFEVLLPFLASEALRQAYPDEEYDWLHLTGFIHDLGKVLGHPKMFNQPQWAVVGDTFPLGCAFSQDVVFSEFFNGNPDSTHPVYSSKVPSLPTKRRNILMLTNTAVRSVRASLRPSQRGYVMGSRRIHVPSVHQQRMHSP